MSRSSGTQGTSGDSQRSPGVSLVLYEKLPANDDRHLAGRFPFAGVSIAGTP